MIVIIVTRPQIEDLKMTDTHLTEWIALDRFDHREHHAQA
jgi:hypothetical protein